MNFIVSRIIKTFLTVLATAAILIGIVFGGSKIWQLIQNRGTDSQEEQNTEETAPERDKTVEVSVISAQIPEKAPETATTSSKRTQIKKTGLIIADQEVEVFPEVTAQITKLYISEGQSVKKGQLIAEIGNSSQLDIAKVNYNSAIRSLKIAEQSLRTTQHSNYANQATFDNQIRTAESSVRTAIDQLSNSQLVRYQDTALTQAQNQVNNLQGNTGETETSEELAAAQKQLQLLQNNANANQELTQDKQAQLQIYNAQNQLELVAEQLESSRLQGQLQELNSINQINQVRQQLETAQINVRAGQIVSPINGVVSLVTSKNGDRVTPSAPMFTITNLSSSIIQTTVTPMELFEIATDQPVSITFYDQTVAAKILSISPVANKQTKTITIKVAPVESASTPIIPNTFAKVNFRTKSAQTAKGPAPEAKEFRLPISVIKFTNQGPQVAIVNNNKISYKTVSLGPIQGGHSAIQEGLNQGELIVITPRHLPEGTEVQVIN